MKQGIIAIVLLSMGLLFFTGYEARAEWIDLPLVNPGAETGDTTGWDQRPGASEQFAAVKDEDMAYQGEWIFSLSNFDVYNAYVSQTVDLSGYQGRMRGLEFGAYFNIRNDRQTRIGYDVETDKEYEYQCYIMPGVLFFDQDNMYIPGSGRPLPDIVSDWHYRSENTLNWDQDQWEVVNQKVDHAEVSIRFGYYGFPFEADQPYPYQIEEWRQWLGDVPAIEFDAARVRIDIDDSIWEKTYVDCGRTFQYMTARSLRVDKNGRPHLVYGSGHLYYAWFDGADWQHELVDSDYTTGQYAALALDTANNPHIIYLDLAKGNLKYARKSAGSEWYIEVIAGVKKNGSGTSIVLDDENNPHISYNYYDRAIPGGYLIYARRDNEGWHVETVSSEWSYGDWYTSIALDGNNNPHIGYCSDYGDSFKSMLKYATRNESGWHTQIVDFVDGINYEQPSIAVDPTGHPHISYADVSNYDLKFASWNGAEWQTQVLDSTGNVGMYSSLVFGTNGFPQISYFDWTNHKVKHLFRDSEIWHMTVIGDADYYFMFTSIDLDQFDRPHVAYMDDHRETLKHAFWDGTEWQVSVVAEAEYIGYNPSLEIDSDGNARISYQNRTTSQIKYAFQDETGWHTEVLDSGAEDISNSALALDNHGFSHIVYADRRNDALKYAVHDGFGWDVTLVENQLNADMMALEIDNLGFSHIVFNERKDGLPDQTSQLRYGFNSGTGWVMEPVSLIEELPDWFSITLDGQNIPHVSYMGLDDDLQYARKGSLGWEFETVDSQGRVGSDSSLDTDKNGYPHISYVDDTNGTLKYAFKDISGWHKETAPIVGYVGGNTAIGVDSFDNPHILFYGHVDGSSIRYIKKTPSGWHNELVDDDGSVGIYSGISLEIDAIGQPHVSYYDDTCGCVKYARRVSMGSLYDVDNDGDVDGKDLQSFTNDTGLLTKDIGLFAFFFGSQRTPFP